MPSLADFFPWLGPELLIAVSAFAVLGVELVQRDRSSWPIYLSLGGVALAFLATLALWGSQQSVLFGTYTVDAFSNLVKIVSLVITALVILVGMDYVVEGQVVAGNPGEAAAARRPAPTLRGEFYALLLFAALSMMLMASSTDLIMIYLSVEFLSITSYILVGYLREEPLSNEASLKYFLYGAIISPVMLYGLSLLYGLAGSTGLAEVAAALSGSAPELMAARPLVLMIILFVVAGLGFKVSVVPFHQWAPDAYEGAPTPYTAFISVAPKLAGAAVLIRVLVTAFPFDLGPPAIFQRDWMSLLAGISAISMTLGNLIAIPQQNIKRMLAYSSIAQAGYIMIGVAAGSTLGIVSALFYLVVYTFSNLGAFAVVISYSNWSGSDNIADYRGLSQRAPGLAFAMVLFLLSLAGIPPLAGFIGKILLFAAAVERGMIWLVVVGVLNTIVSLYYYLNVVKAMYIIPGGGEEPLPRSRALMGAVLVTVIAVLGLGVYPQPFVDVVQTVASAFLAG